MQKLKNLEFYIPLIIGIYLLFAFRINIFVLPYSYSETDFLSQMAFSKDNTQLALFANNLPNIPAVIYYLVATIFGTNIMAVRITEALFAILEIIVVFKFGNFFFGKQAGIFAATILILQNVFLAQFATVQPEIINSVLLISALYCFLREKYRTMCIWLLLAVNIHIASILTLLFLLVAFLLKRNTTGKAQSLVFFLIPIVIYATVEVVNFILYEQLSVLKDFSLSDFANGLIDRMNFTFVEQLRLCLSLILVISIIAAALQRQIEIFEIKNYVYIFVLMLLIVVSETMANSDNCALAVSVALLAIITGAAFSSINMYYPYKYIIISTLIILFAVFAARSRNISCEYLSHTHQTETDLRAVKFISENVSPTDSVMCSEHFARILTNSYLGYVSQKPANIDTAYNPTKYRYIIKGNDPKAKNINATLLEDNSMLEKSFTKKDAETDIYSIEQ